MSSDTSPEDYLPFLTSLEKEQKPWFLIGGQAVNFWAEFYSHTGTPDPGLGELQPFTSRDCDIWVANETFRFLRENYEEKLQVAKSPSDGQLAILELEEAQHHVIDILDKVFGFNQPRDSNRLLERSLLYQDVRIIDPISLFRCKCHCYLNLDQTDRQDLKHLHMLTFILQEHFKQLLEAAETKQIIQRDLLAEIKNYRALTKDKWVRRALEKIDFSLETILPIDEMRQSGLTVVARFAKQTWPA